MSDEQKPSFTIPKWCEKYGITPPTYFDARKRGETPDEVRIGRSVRITVQADAEWNERRTAAQREAREAREAAARAQTEAPVFTLEQAPVSVPVKVPAKPRKTPATPKGKRTVKATTKRTTKATSKRAKRPASEPQAV
jgi:predicted DNA-binding transcriptional regulator AlpA